MGERTIESLEKTGQFPPLVSIRQPGNFVKGKVTNVGLTANNNPVVSMDLIDLNGQTQRSVSKGVYTEVDVNVGEPVQLVGSNFQLKQKLPQLVYGDIVTVTFIGKKKMSNGRSLNEFKVVVE